ncbi:MarP family serine protease [Actinoallomurus sp. NPDC050550]|uniref:MarP family serine protease n=1 Tax=Actinoallomurus sp. NPDC050550 TaxID=3154937 RepID=UPI003407473D
MGDHILDLILLVLVVLFAISGYRQGFIVGVLSFVGFVGGVVLGMLIAPPLVKAVVDGAAQQALLAVVIAFLAATLGQLIASSVGSALRSRVTWESARSVDAVGGACVSSVALLVVAWFIGTAVVSSPVVWLSKQVKNSEVLHGVDAFMPQQATTWFSSFRGFVSKTEFPQVFGGLGGEPITEVPPPDTKILNTPQLQAAEKSIVKVMGTAHSCQRRIEGTGFVYAPGRVMTNAHVVAGVDSGPTVYTLGEGNYRAKVVLYDDKRDIAILDVPGLRLPALKFDEGGQSRDNAVVAGFPKNQKFTPRAARIRAKQKAKGPDIYHSGQVTREIFAIRALVEQGNSGGPLLAPNGKVYGVVFAAALDNKDTGYALTAHEVAPDAQAGVDASGSVSTEACSD